MKLRIKTAHGYLSFQPDGRLEYREHAGAWEEIDLEGLDLREFFTIPPPDPPPVAVGPPASETVAYVAAVKAQLVAQGVPLTGPCGAFQITKRVAWGLRFQGYGLLSKPSGNNCEGYATDIVMKNNGAGDIVDVLGDGGGQNTPLWGISDTVDPGRWRPPVQP